MLDTQSELLERIRLGEDSLLELKEVRFKGEQVQAPGRDSLADELAAFGNSRGGVCVLGVEDDTRIIVGIPEEKLDAVESLVREVCNDSIRPPLMPHIERMMLPSTLGDRRAVIKIDVERSLFVHESPSGYFYRVGSSKRKMAPDYLARLFQQRSQSRIIRFDEQVVPKVTLDDLKPELWQRFRTERSTDDRDELLTKLAMARRDEDGVVRPSVAGVVLGTAEPQRWLSNAYIQAVAYRGNEARPDGDGGLYQLDATDITGPLDQQVLEACRFVRKNMRVFASKGVGREDTPQYHLGAVFEALVNAVAHRDYAIYGSKVRLRMFADRLELYSPGSLTNTMELSALPLRQAARNEAITSLLARCRIPQEHDWLPTTRATLMDRRGEGVGIILAESEKLSGRKPLYELIDDAELRLTIYAAGATTRVSDEVAD
jgi:predicted HTH transcriptional regulator